ncbi:MAG: ParB/RepB/Spo0J family partition protein [Candidatus Cloacimonetes bacterium]|nr:ParB/RepB/Spo0J family partition protein [Candidatus Cloacimonadota bacterium]
MKKLGRGLDALIESGPESTDRTTGITTVSIEYIQPNRYQPRKSFDNDKLRELAQSLDENGMIQPIIVTKRDETHYELIAGERRLEAARIAGFTTVPVIIRSVSAQEQLLFAVIENVQREDLNAIDEAMAYLHMVDDFGLKQEQIAALVGKSRTAISNTLRLLNLSHEVRLLVSEEKLSAGHARAVLQVEPERQQEFAREIVSRNWSVRQAEVDSRKKSEDLSVPPEKPEKVPPGAEAVIGEMENQLKHNYHVKVTIKDRNNKGAITFFYNNEDERIALIKRFMHKEDN